MDPASDKGPIMLMQEASINFLSRDFDQTQLKQGRICLDSHCVVIQDHHDGENTAVGAEGSWSHDIKSQEAERAACWCSAPLS